MKLLLTSDLDILFPKIKHHTALKGHKNLAFIPETSANADYGDYFERHVKPLFAGISIKAHLLVLAEHSAQTLKSAIEPCDVLYVGGGNTFMLLEKMQAVNFKHILPPFFKKGGLYIGASAGSVVACPDIQYAAAVDDPRQARLKTTAGLGLVEMSIVPHIDHKDFGAECRKICQDLKNEKRLVVGLKDNQALYVQDNYIEFI